MRVKSALLQPAERKGEAMCNALGLIGSLGEEVESDVIDHSVVVTSACIIIVIANKRTYASRSMAGVLYADRTFDLAVPVFIE